MTLFFAFIIFDCYFIINAGWKELSFGTDYDVECYSIDRYGSAHIYSNTDLKETIFSPNNNALNLPGESFFYLQYNLNQPYKIDHLKMKINWSPAILIKESNLTFMSYSMRGQQSMFVNTEQTQKIDENDKVYTMYTMYPNDINLNISYLIISIDFSPYSDYIFDSWYITYSNIQLKYKRESEYKFVGSRLLIAIFGGIIAGISCLLCALYTFCNCECYDERPWKQQFKISITLIFAITFFFFITYLFTHDLKYFFVIMLNGLLLHSINYQFLMANQLFSTYFNDIMKQKHNFCTELTSSQQKNRIIHGFMRQMSSNVDTKRAHKIREFSSSRLESNDWMKKRLIRLESNDIECVIFKYDSRNINIDPICGIISRFYELHLTYLKKEINFETAASIRNNKLFCGVIICYIIWIILGALILFFGIQNIYMLVVLILFWIGLIVRNIKLMAIYDGAYNHDRQLARKNLRLFSIIQLIKNCIELLCLVGFLSIIAFTKSINDSSWFVGSLICLQQIMYFVLFYMNILDTDSIQ